MKNNMFRKGFVVGIILLFFGASTIPTALSIRESVEQRNNRSAIDYNRGYLLITDSTSDTVGMYDPNDGTYLGDLINGVGLFSTPINAIRGPDGNIYVSDQVADSVFVFDQAGNYLSTYADASDGLDNIRGIDFRGTHLFVSTSPTSSPKCIAEFSGPHIRLPDFIQDGSDPFDILFLPDGRALVADIAGSTDNIRLYSATGVLQQVLFQINFPEQIQTDSLAPGAYLNAAFSANTISDFELTGVIVQSTPYSGGRGVFRLGNGNLLATSGAGVQEIQPGTGAIIQTEKTGSCHFIELSEAVANQPPYEPNTPNPPHGATGVPLNATLSWIGGDPNPGDTVTYDVYFGTSTPPPKKVSNQSATTYTPGTMYSNTKYYWKIVAWDNLGSSTPGPIWEFTTRMNNPPNIPTINGPAKGKIGVATTYNFTTTDPDGDKVYYFIDWGDQTNSSWIGPYPSGDEINQSHTWSKKGTYTIKAKAKDISGNESDWRTFSVKMPTSYNIPMLRFLDELFDRFPHIFPILRHLLGY
jgi:hypothetical protein